MNSFIANFKRAMSAKAVFTALIVAGLCFCSSAITGENSPPTIAEFMADTSRYNNIYFHNVAVWFDNSFWFNIILPVILSFPAVSDFYAEWFGGGYYSNISRQSVIKYAASKSAAYSLSAMLCFLTGGLIYLLAAAVFVPSAGAELVVAFYPNGFADFLTGKLLNYTAVCGIYPVFCVALLIIIKEKFLCLSVPLITNYITAHIGVDLQKKAYSEENVFYDRLSALMPYMQVKQYEGFERLFGLPIFVRYIAAVMCWVLLIFILYLLIMRRIKTNA